ncbi:MAG: hypothetical protein PSV18_15140 [Methylobacter sp.]|nr:hypothetical protein [Candidatus Methylobacter titanis]
MQWLYLEYGAEYGTHSNTNGWSDAPDCKNYGDLTEHGDAIRKHLKIHFSELKEKQLKDLLERKTWLDQKNLLLKARQLQQAIGTAQHDDMNGFDDALNAACKKSALALDAKEKKQLKAAVSWKNPVAEKVIKKIHSRSSASMPPRHTTTKDGGSAENAGSNFLPVHPEHKTNPLYGWFAVNGQVLEYQADTDLRDNENVALDPSKTVNAINEAYFIKEVQPHVRDAWIDASKKDHKDQEIGLVGYEIPFNRHFYQYQPPRDLVDIDADLDAVSGEIMKLLQEVHS